MRPTNLAIFFVMLGLTIYSLLYLFVDGKIVNFIFDMQFYLLVASTAYLGFLIFYEFKTQGRLSDNYENMVSESNRFFMTTHFSKFLFPIFFAIFFLFICRTVLFTNFHIFDYTTFFQALVLIHVNLILPIYMFCELFLIDHTRVPKYTSDMLILAIIFIVRWGLALIFKSIFIKGYGLSDGISELGDVLMGMLISINGYFLYDFILFKKINPEGNYSVMIQS